MVGKRPALKLATAEVPPAGRLSRADGERVLAQAGVAGLRDALADVLGPQARPLPAVDDGWTLFWLGFVQQFDDWLLARRTWDEAQRRFDAAADGAGQHLVRCAIIQCGHFDQQSIPDFAQRCGTAFAACPGELLGPTLALFELTARTIAAAYGADPRGAEGPHRALGFEQVFLALGREALDPTLRLYAATAALRGIGLSFDRVRAEDFHAAGATLAAAPQVGLYARLQWHLWLLFARSRDAALADQVIGAMQALVPAEPHGACRTMVARGRLCAALVELNRAAPAAARRLLEAAHPGLDPAYPNDYALYHSLAAKVALVSDDPVASAAHARLCLLKLEAGAAADGARAVACNDAGMAEAAAGQLDAAAESFGRAAALDHGAQTGFASCHRHLARALCLLRDAQLDEARAELRAGLLLAGRMPTVPFFRLAPRVAAQVCGAALDLSVEPDPVRALVVQRALACPDIGIAQWPWPLRVRLLGPFGIERDGAPLRFGRKMPRRLLDLLQLVAALGGRDVDAARVAQLLWPDAEGDGARDALKAMLHRARTLLGGELLVVRGGTISYDERAAWLDIWALEHVTGRIEALLGAGAAARDLDAGLLERLRLQLLALYRGHFLGEGEIAPWALPMRDRLRARFVRAVESLGHCLERLGRWDSAVALYRAALEQDNLAEELYQRLIECHLARGEPTQALNAFRRCRELLSIVLGLRPSARTEALVARIRGA